MFNTNQFIIRVITSGKIRWTGQVPLMREMRKAHKILVETLQGRRLLERTRNRREDSIKMDITSTECEDLDSIERDQGSD
jgi:hypothetical protein